MKKKFFKSLLIALIVYSVSFSVFANTNEEPLKTGIQEYRNRNYSKSISIMNKIIEIEQNNYYAHYYLAISHVKLGNYEEAENHYKAIINNSDDERLLYFAKKGLLLLNPETEETPSESVIQNVSKPRNIIIETPKQTATNTEPEVYYPKSTPKTKEDVIDYSKEIDQSFTNQQDSPTNNQNLQAIANQNKVSMAELNNLIQLLSKNPKALETLNKLAGSNNPNLNQVANSFNLGLNGLPKDFDYGSVAKLMKSMMLNSQMDAMFNSNNDDKKNSNNDFLGMMSGFNPMQPSMMGNNTNKMQMLMQYLNKSNNQQMDPKMMNMMMNQNLFSGF